MNSLLVFFWLNGINGLDGLDSSCLGLDWHTQLLQGFLCTLCLLPFSLNFQRVAGTFAGSSQLVQPQLLWCFRFLKLEDSHAFIYGDG